MKKQKYQKTALVTGGAQGIGRAIAEEFTANGIITAVADIDTEAGTELQRKKPGIIFLPCDVRREEDVKNVAEQINSRFASLDILVNNAGGGGLGIELSCLSLEQWNDILSLNLTSSFLFSKYCLPLLMRSANPSIINISSTRALQSEKNTEAYSAAKGGVLALTHALAISLGPKIRVNCISPGWIRTEQWRKESQIREVHYSEADHSQHPAGRIGLPEDIAAIALFLASEKAGFITGQNFVADGGMTKKMIYI